MSKHDTENFILREVDNSHVQDSEFSDSMKEQEMWSKKCPDRVDLLIQRCNISDDRLRNCLSRFTKVAKLDLSGSNFTILPACIKECHSLWMLNLDNCKDLRDVEGMPPILMELEARNCTSLSVESQSLLLSENLHRHPSKISSYCHSYFCVPTGSIPKWFERQSGKEAISFWIRNSFPTPFLFCYLSPRTDAHSRIDYKVFINDQCAFNARNYPYGGKLNEDHLYMYNLKEQDMPDHLRERVWRKNKWNHVRVEAYALSNDGQRMIAESGMHVINNHSKTFCKMEDITFQNPYDSIVDSAVGDQEISDDDGSDGDTDSNYTNNDEQFGTRMKEKQVSPNKKSMLVGDDDFASSSSAFRCTERGRNSSITPQIPFGNNAGEMFTNSQGHSIEDDEQLSLRPFSDESACHQEFQQPENVTSTSVEQVPESFEDNNFWKILWTRLCSRLCLPFCQ